MKTLFDDVEVYRRAGSECDGLRWRITGDGVQVSSDSGMTWRPHGETQDQVRRSFMKGYIVHENAV